MAQDGQVHSWPKMAWQSTKGYNISNPSLLYKSLGERIQQPEVLTTAAKFGVYMESVTAKYSLLVFTCNVNTKNLLKAPILKGFRQHDSWMVNGLCSGILPQL